MAQETKIDDEDVFAVFVIARTESGNIAATTRAKDRGESGKIGLPGGKVDSGENLEEAVFREAYEEGWEIEGPLTMVNKDIVEGKVIVWFTGGKATMLDDYKEKGRIRPIEVSKEMIASSGYGNDFINGLDI